MRWRTGDKEVKKNRFLQSIPGIICANQPERLGNSHRSGCLFMKHPLGEKKKNLTLVVCFLLMLKGEIKKMSDTCSLFPSLETPGLPACYPLTIPWTAACQASLSLTVSWSLLKLMSIESMMSSNHFSSCHPLLLLSSIFPSIRVFSNELVLLIGWPK